MTMMATPGADVQPVETVSVTIDGVTIDVPKGTMIIRAAEQLGIAVPRFCDHPALEPVAACRMCLVEVEGQAKPQPSCAIPCSDGMVVRTQNSSEMADKAQAGVMEFLLINHPLDCPVCDKGGECPLQNQAMTAGAADTRFDGKKRTFDKPINVSAQVLLDRERCVSCARCTRFADEIAGDAFIDLLERGAQQQVGTSDDEAFDSYFSGNTIQICPVGALTSANYRFRARPFDLVSTPTVCEHCSSGCNLRTDHRRHTVMRRLAWDNPQVNEEWNCDKGRFAFTYTQIDRITHPMVRGEDGELHVASWPHALAVAATGLKRAAGNVGVLTGGRLSHEDAYAYSRFARVALGTDDIDFRNRVATAEEAAFLGHAVARSYEEVTYKDLETAPFVLLASFEPEDESPIVFLRLRKSARAGITKVATIAPFASEGSRKLKAQLIATAPGDEAAAIAALASDIRSALAQPGAVILVGERAAATAGALTAVAALAESTGAKLAWIPRRAGERGALVIGAIAGLLPGGRPLEDASAREHVESIWGASIPTRKGRYGDQIIEAAAAGEIDALVIAGVDPRDSQDPAAFAKALASDAFIVSLETRHSAVTEAADVVFPVAVVTEKQGMFMNWEGRVQAFGAVSQTTTILPDARVLADLAEAMGVTGFPTTVTAARREMRAIGMYDGPRLAAPSAAAAPAKSGVRVAMWHELLDAGVMQEGEPFLAATARPVVARTSAATAAAAGIADGEDVAISCNGSSITLPLVVTAGMVDNVVWMPANAVDCNPTAMLGAHSGDAVQINRAGGQ